MEPLGVIRKRNDNGQADRRTDQVITLEPSLILSMKTLGVIRKRNDNGQADRRTDKVITKEPPLILSSGALK